MLETHPISKTGQSGIAVDPKLSATKVRKLFAKRSELIELLHTLHYDAPAFRDTQDAICDVFDMLQGRVPPSRTQSRRETRSAPPARPLHGIPRSWRLAERAAHDRPAEVIRLEPSAPVSVAISTPALKTMREEIFSRRKTGVECGGGIYGGGRDGGAITLATVFAGPGVLRTKTSMLFRVDDLFDTAGGVRGYWHSHGARNDTTPSPADLTTGLQLLDNHGLARSLLIIAAIDELRGWASPRFAAWCIDRTRLGTARYFRAKLEMP